MKGKVAVLKDRYGFIKDQDGISYYFRKTNDLTHLKVGDEVVFHPFKEEKGWAARAVDTVADFEARSRAAAAELKAAAAARERERQERIENITYGRERVLQEHAGSAVGAFLKEVYAAFPPGEEEYAYIGWYKIYIWGLTAESLLIAKYGSFHSIPKGMEETYAAAAAELEAAHAAAEAEDARRRAAYEQSQRWRALFDVLRAAAQWVAEADDRAAAFKIAAANGGVVVRWCGDDRIAGRYRPRVMIKGVIGRPMYGVRGDSQNWLILVGQAEETQIQLPEYGSVDAGIVESPDGWGTRIAEGRELCWVPVTAE